MSKYDKKQYEKPRFAAGDVIVGKIVRYRILPSVFTVIQVSDSWYVLREVNNATHNYYGIHAVDRSCTKIDRLTALVTYGIKI